MLKNQNWPPMNADNAHTGSSTFGSRHYSVYKEPLRSFYSKWPVTCSPRTANTQRRPPVAKGFVSITAERCKGCGFCVEFCPTHVLAPSSAFNAKGYHPPHTVAADKCSGCDLCGM